MTQRLQAGEKHPIADCLRELGITQVAIIDDAYDSPTIESFDGGEIGGFWTAIEREEEMSTEMKQLLGREVRKQEDIDNEVIRELWRGLDKLEKLSDPCRNQLFPTKLQKRHDVDLLSDHLRNLDLDPVTLGAEDDLPDPSIKLVFLDYVLNPAATGNPGELATLKAKEIYRRDAEKPFIILISAVPNVDQQKEKFREDSGLLGGLFGFIAKEDIRDREKLYLKLNSLGIGNPTHHAIQRFVDTLVESVKLTPKAFEDKIRALDIQDYTFIQRVSLHEDGQPLGDYILWLFESTLAYIFRGLSRVREEQTNLDKLKFHKYLPCQTQPSTRLAELYKCALTEPAIEELISHPLDETDTMPLLYLGDIFIKDEDSSFLMVINAACDLMVAPLGSRKCDPEQPIYFVPGSLERLHEIKNGRQFSRTELFEYKGIPYRIIWDHQHVFSKEYKSVRDYLHEQGYSRKSRLRLPYALQVQQSFVSNLARIGMPVPPPIFDKADVEVYCLIEEKKLIRIGDPISDGVVILYNRRGEHFIHQFILTYPCVSILLDSLKVIIKNIEAQKAKLNTQDEHYTEKLNALNGKIEKIGNLKTESQIWQKLIEEPKDFPKTGSPRQLKAGLLDAYSDLELEKVKTNTLLVLNIKDKRGLGQIQNRNG